ncbi:hypothetical protein [uncultured Roseibium sp.]|uniref:hypothetical protein n=1 Tax=uncultured Roseibium sp. TaxID=1936171 RepID=UPI0026300EB3|nr:hypothetical protein [uncultured Roseibium sp.]
MSGETGKPKFRSVGTQGPMRSRGFLSRPGSAAAPLQDKGSGIGAAISTEQQHHRSRGGRQVVLPQDGKPKDLSLRPYIRPYGLEEEE